MTQIRLNFLHDASISFSLQRSLHFFQEIPFQYIFVEKSPDEKNPTNSFEKNWIVIQ